MTTYEKTDAHPCGLADRPYYLSEIVHDEFLDVACFKLYDLDAYVTVGHSGFEWYDHEDVYAQGGFPNDVTVYVDADLPTSGWAPRSVRSDQTGGMCMVDVVVFENGHVLSITDECGLLWQSERDYDDSPPMEPLPLQVIHFVLDDAIGDAAERLENAADVMFDPELRGDSETMHQDAMRDLEALAQRTLEPRSVAECLATPGCCNEPTLEDRLPPPGPVVELQNGCAYVATLYGAVIAARVLHHRDGWIVTAADSDAFQTFDAESEAEECYRAAVDRLADEIIQDAIECAEREAGWDPTP